MHYFYVLQSTTSRDAFYFGCSSDLKKRLMSHQAGNNHATRGEKWRLVYYEAYLTLSGARKREYRVKHHGSARRYPMDRIRPTLE